MEKLPTRAEYIRQSLKPWTGGTTYYGHENTECEICHDSYNDSNHAPYQLSGCRHMFGDECVWTWLTEANTCPKCRDVLFPCDSDDTLDEERVVDDTDWSSLDEYLFEDLGSSDADFTDVEYGLFDNPGKRNARETRLELAQGLEDTVNRFIRRTADELDGPGNEERAALLLSLQSLTQISDYPKPNGDWRSRGRGGAGGTRTSSGRGRRRVQMACRDRRLGNHYHLGIPLDSEHTRFAETSLFGSVSVDDEIPQSTSDLSGESESRTCFDANESYGYGASLHLQEISVDNERMAVNSDEDLWNFSDTRRLCDEGKTQQPFEDKCVEVHNAGQEYAQVEWEEEGDKVEDDMSDREYEEIDGHWCYYGHFNHEEGSCRQYLSRWRPARDRYQANPLWRMSQRH